MAGSSRSARTWISSEYFLQRPAFEQGQPRRSRRIEPARREHTGTACDWLPIGRVDDAFRVSAHRLSIFGPALVRP